MTFAEVAARIRGEHSVPPKNRHDSVVLSLLELLEADPDFHLRERIEALASDEESRAEFESDYCSGKTTVFHHRDFARRLTEALKGKEGGRERNLLYQLWTTDLLYRSYPTVLVSRRPTRLRLRPMPKGDVSMTDLPAPPKHYSCGVSFVTRTMTCARNLYEADIAALTAENGRLRETLLAQVKAHAHRRFHRTSHPTCGGCIADDQARALLASEGKP